MQQFMLQAAERKEKDRKKNAKKMLNLTQLQN